MNIVFSIIWGLVSGIVSGIIASIIIHMFWQTRKPKIEISKNIAINDKGEYRIKIINKTKNYVSDVNLQLQVIKPENGPDGIVIKKYNLTMPYPKILWISPFKKNDENYENAIRVVLPKNLEQNWTEDTHQYIKLIVLCSNELKTSSKVFEQCYHKKHRLLEASLNAKNQWTLLLFNHNFQVLGCP